MGNLEGVLEADDSQDLRQRSQRSGHPPGSVRDRRFAYKTSTLAVPSASVSTRRYSCRNAL
jgi:hypothetical protein